MSLSPSGCRQVKPFAAPAQSTADVSQRLSKGRGKAGYDQGIPSKELQ
jgi:hypothetical protein